MIGVIKSIGKTMKVKCVKDFGFFKEGNIYSAFQLDCSCWTVFFNDKNEMVGGARNVLNIDFSDFFLPIDYLTEQPSESTKEVLKEMYPRPLTPEEAGKEVLDYFKNGSMPGVVTRRLKNGIVVTKLPFELEIPEGYEMAKLNPKTGQFECSDGTVEHHPSQMRKIQ